MDGPDRGQLRPAGAGQAILWVPALSGGCSFTAESRSPSIPSIGLPVCFCQRRYARLGAAPREVKLANPPVSRSRSPSPYRPDPYNVHALFEFEARGDDNKPLCWPGLPKLDCQLPATRRLDSVCANGQVPLIEDREFCSVSILVVRGRFNRGRFCIRLAVAASVQLNHWSRPRDRGAVP